MNRFELIRKREAHATRGPWIVRRRSEEEGDYWASTTIQAVWTEPVRNSVGHEVARISGGDKGPDNRVKRDAEFVAHSREDVPWLIRRVEALQEAHEKYEDLAKRLLERDPEIDSDEVEETKGWMQQTRALLEQDDLPKEFP